MAEIESSRARIAQTSRTKRPKQPRIPLLVGIGAVLAAPPVLADNWRITSSASATETYTSNVNYGSQGSNQGDFVTSVSGALQINGVGPRARLNGTIAATGLLYAGQSEHNSIAPTVNLTGNVEAIEKFFYIDAQANVSQTYYSALGAQPGSLVNATANRYTSQAYSVSPYMLGHIGGSTVSYLVRDDNYWSIASQYGDSSISVPGTYSNNLHASVSAPPTPLGWTVSYDGTYYGPSGGDFYSGARVQNHYTTQIARVVLAYQIDPLLQISARGGYEINRFPLTSSESPVYGAGFQWSPTDRTQVGGFWEERFYGSSYSLQASHRLPRTAFSASFSKGLNTTPRNALSIPAGADVASFVDAAFTSRIPDPAERALAVQQFLAKSGLPATLATPVNIYTASLQLQESGNLSMVLIGLHNSLAFNVFYLRSDSISANGELLPQQFQFGQNTTQTGAGVAYSYQLGAQTSLTASGTVSQATSNATEGALVGQRSRNLSMNLGVGAQLGPRTNTSAGIGYTRFEPIDAVGSSTTSSVNVFATISHAF